MNVQVRRIFQAMGCSITLGMVGMSSPAVGAQPAAVDAKASPAGAKHTFWAVPKQSGGTMYILGSIHFANEDLYPLPAVITQAFEESETLVLEVDMGAVQSPSFAFEMMQKGMYEEGDRIQDHISEETFSLLERESERAGFPVSHFLRFKPWYCGNFLMISALKKHGYNPVLGVDIHFYREATAADKRVIGLESPEFQLGLLSGLSEKEADEFLFQALTELCDIRAFADSLLRMWRLGDTERLGALIAESFEGADDLYEVLFTKRNLAWVERLTGLAESPGDLFVVVGAGHLVGEGGLVDLLSKAGFSPRQL